MSGNSFSLGRGLGANIVLLLIKTFIKQDFGKIKAKLLQCRISPCSRHIPGLIARFFVPCALTLSS
jgi:hypothetical protein